MSSAQGSPVSVPIDSAMKPLSRSLESRLLALVSAARVRAVPTPNVPQFATTDSVDRLRALCTTSPYGHLDVPVWDGASDRTIWSSPEVNYAFRAWHDSHHVALREGFDDASESRLCDYALSFFPDPAHRAILKAEIRGQVEYFYRWDRFPIDQRAFVVAYVADPASALETEGF